MHLTGDSALRPLSPTGDASRWLPKPNHQPSFMEVQKMSQNWVSLFGSVEIADGLLTLVPNPIPPVAPNAASVIPYAVVRSNLEFEQGTVEFEVWLPDPDSRCYISFGGGSQVELYAGLNIIGAPYGFATFQNGQWEPIAGVGHGSRLEEERWHRLKVHAQGSNLDMFVNDVKVISTSYRIVRGPVSLYLESYGRLQVRNVTTATEKPICFVIMQFTDEYNSLYADVIRPTCQDYGYKVIRADDSYTSGSIIDDITRSIRESTIIIADITPNNPNVFYEVGFAHGINKPTILLSDRKRELPFDVSGFRTLFYDNTIGGKSSVEERLKRHLPAIGA
jgi:hypothetical protein